MTEHAKYTVIGRYGWYYVVGDPAPRIGGPWRYRRGAQEEADRLREVRQKMLDLWGNPVASGQSD